MRHIIPILAPITLVLAAPAGGQNSTTNAAEPVAANASAPAADVTAPAQTPSAEATTPAATPTAPADTTEPAPSSKTFPWGILGVLGLLGLLGTRRRAS